MKNLKRPLFILLCLISQLLVARENYGLFDSAFSKNNFPISANVFVGKPSLSSRGFTNEAVEVSLGYHQFVLTSRFFRTEGINGYFFEDAIEAGWKYKLPKGFYNTLSIGCSDLAFERSIYYNPEISRPNFHKTQGLLFEERVGWNLIKRDRQPSAWGFSASYYFILDSYKNISGTTFGVDFSPTAVNWKHPFPPKRTELEKQQEKQKRDTAIFVNGNFNKYIDSNRVVWQWRVGAGIFKKHSEANFDLIGMYENFSLGFHLIAPQGDEYGAPNMIAITAGRSFPIYKNISAVISGGYIQSKQKELVTEYFNNWNLQTYAYVNHDGFMINPEINIVQRFGKKTLHKLGFGASLGYALIYPTTHSAPQHLLSASFIFIPGDGVKEHFCKKPRPLTHFHIDANATIGTENHAMILGGSLFTEYKNFVLGMRSSVTGSGWKGPDVDFNFYREYAALGGYRIHMDRAWITFTGGYCYEYLGNEELKGNGDNIPFSHMNVSPRWYNSFTAQVEIATIMRSQGTGWGLAYFTILNSYMPVNGLALNFKFGKLH